MPLISETPQKKGRATSSGGRGMAFAIRAVLLWAGVTLALWWSLSDILQQGLRRLSEDPPGLLMPLFERRSEPTDSIEAAADVVEGQNAPELIELDKTVVPFREIGHRLGPRAWSNSGFEGAAIFDANGDGRLDLYLPHSGRPTSKRTTDDHILTDELVASMPSTLFLNQGNDGEGDPILRSVQDLAAHGNSHMVREELLIENKYLARGRIDQDETAPGRVGVGAVAADFNGDGRMDLYVLNLHYGLMGQTEELGLRVYPARDNLGREARGPREALVIQAPPFLRGELSDGLGTLVGLGDKPEAEGRNSLYLNRGDQDGDSIPEWEDATESLGVGGHWASTSAAVADFDRDGDLDLYVANFLDPDFFGFGDTHFAGNRNQLYVNQLSETGKLGFRNRAEELGVAGLHDNDGLATLPSAEQIVGGRGVGERADHSWAALFTDWNLDGWPDLVVANDLSNRLRVYANLAGERFRYIESFNEPVWNGSWMGMSVGDLDGDLREEVLITNCGAQVMSARNTALFVESSTELNTTARLVINYPRGLSTIHHGLLSYRPDVGFLDLAPHVKVHHSPHIPPDLSNSANFSSEHIDLFKENNFATSLTSYEFAFNAPLLDVDNDGDLDVYMAGSLSRGNDDYLGDWSGSPGRLLVNESTPGHFVFRDLTLEYRLLDVTHMDYSSNPPRRPSPGTNWHKRDYIYATDVDSYSGMGLDASQSSIHDIFRMHEAAAGIYAADLNDDGFEDLLVRHAGGYNSLSPQARNLRVRLDDQVMALPAPNKVVKAPTGFEEGKTFLYVNGGAPLGKAGHWVKVRLLDGRSHNRYGVGAKVVINNQILRRLQIGGGAALGATSSDLHVGLGAAELRSLEITWPAGDPPVQRIDLDPPIRDRRICVERDRGVVPCNHPKSGALDLRSSVE